jgi:hypothetical protein
MSFKIDDALRFKSGTLLDVYYPRHLLHVIEMDEEHAVCDMYSVLNDELILRSKKVALPISELIYIYRSWNWLTCGVVFKLNPQKFFPFSQY